MNNKHSIARRRRVAMATFAGLACIAVASPAMAYVGPGAGLSLIGALWAVVVAVAAALFFVVAWPIRRMLKRRKLAPAAAAAAPEPADQARARPVQH